MICYSLIMRSLCMFIRNGPDPAAEEFSLFPHFIQMRLRLPFTEGEGSEKRERRVRYGNLEEPPGITGGDWFGRRAEEAKRCNGSIQSSITGTREGLFQGENIELTWRGKAG